MEVWSARIEPNTICYNAAIASSTLAAISAKATQFFGDKKAVMDGILIINLSTN